MAFLFVYLVDFFVDFSTDFFVVFGAEKWSAKSFISAQQTRFIARATKEVRGIIRRAAPTEALRRPIRLAITRVIAEKIP